MSSAESRTCAVCGDVAESVTEHAVHASLAHPELNRRALRERRETAAPSPAARPVSCWSCAALIPSDAEACVCGKPRPNFQAFGNTDRVGPVALGPERLALSEKLLEKATPVLARQPFRQEYPSQAELLEDRHSRPSARFPGSA